MKKIMLCKLGHFKQPIDFKKIEGWCSGYFKIVHSDEVRNINVDHFNDDYTYPNVSILSDMGEDEDGIDLKIAIVDQPLEREFYMHRLEARKCVVSIFPVYDILKLANIPIENYIIRCVYEAVVFLYEGNGVVNENVYLIPHHETRGCLFDMNVFIEKIVYSSVTPIICDQCKARLNVLPLPENFVNNIQKELKRLKQPLYYRLEKLIKKNPVVSLLIASLLAIILNIIANFISR
ncbi:MAG: hypothetical protein WC315_06470 [Candidatus Omnitrophota bacterium]|jgi:hypothetical protein